MDYSKFNDARDLDKFVESVMEENPEWYRGQLRKYMEDSRPGKSEDMDSYMKRANLAIYELYQKSLMKTDDYGR